MSPRTKKRPEIRTYLLNDLGGAGQMVVSVSTPLLKALAERGTDKIGITAETSIGGVKCAAHPFDQAIYAYAMGINTYHRRACSVKAHHITGMGWDLVPAQTDREGNAKAEAEIREFLTRPHAKMSLAQIMGNCEKDYQGLGNGYLEVRRNVTGKPSKLEHYPSPTMFIRLDDQGYVQKVQNKTAWLKPFGEPEKRAVPGNPALLQNEMVHLADYDSTSPYYGLPCIMPAFGRLVLMQLELEYNSAFFANFAMGRWAVLLEGEFEGDTESVIREHFTAKVKGQPHKTLVLEAPTGGKITFHRLDTDTKDSQFRFLRTDARDEILQAHGVPPMLVGIVETGALGGNVGSEQLKQYRDAIVRTGQERWQNVMDAIIAAGWPDCGWSFRFKEFSIEDQKVNADIDNTYLMGGVLLPNEVRGRRFPDLDPLPDEYLRPADEPVEQAMEGLRKALRELAAAAAETAPAESRISKFVKTVLNGPGRAQDPGPAGTTHKCLINIFKRGSGRFRAGLGRGHDVE